MKSSYGASIAALAIFLGGFTFVSRLHAGDAPKKSETTTVVSQSDMPARRLQGEQRFRANCGRCHAAPQKFPPRMMATVVRHMRVRASITDQDMKLVLFYMTQ
jgi:hypothetical protein